MSLYSPTGWLFCHIRKSGGTSLRNLLQNSGPLIKYLTIPHDPAANVRAHMESIGALGHWNLAYRFTFIRHPYTWVESMRRHAIAQDGHPLGVDARTMSVVEWAQRLFQACDERMPTTDGIICSQSAMICDQDGKPLVHRMCYFENYADEVTYLCGMLGITRPAVLPHDGLSAIPHAEATDEYKAAVAELFAEDFQTLGYTP